jgi:hypothetical protein
MLILGLAFLAGMALLLIARRAEGHLKNIRDYVWHGAREVGFALVIAAVVSVLFEFYQREREADLTTVKNFDANMAEQLTPDVWNDVKRQILKKTLLRRNAEIKFDIIRQQGLRPDQVAMDVDFAYELENLRPENAHITIEHELDYQFSYPDQDLPSFSRITIIAPDRNQSRDLQGAELRRFCPNGILHVELDMPPKLEGKHARIETRRREIVYAPGSYNLYMTEYTKSLIVQRLHPTTGFDVEVKVRPQGVGQSLIRTGDTWKCDELILPGQGVEIKFVDPSRGTAAKSGEDTHQR